MERTFSIAFLTFAQKMQEDIGGYRLLQHFFICGRNPVRFGALIPVWLLNDGIMDSTRCIKSINVAK
ncbi:hypothetical protein E0Y62_07080 [Cytobacillus praedii]|uniref:Uncharacterized protein n=1 Tax=Cytobacillus praedii TaxID=1742358 RepID=A0A4R1B1A6_9BACI|nr:hypothetical protein E0Y62_07080 [Cytobacillus praedii]